MYLKNIIIRHSGPIEKIDIDLPFSEEGKPIPIIFVGGNGVGKSILLASIVDALHEIANQSFDDVLPKQGAGYSYFKVTTPINQKVGSNYSFTFLMFENANQKIEYIEKTGICTFEDCRNETRNILTVNKGWKESENLKFVTDVKNNKEIENDFIKNSYCYFPSNRHEYPHWLNEGKQIDRYGISSNISGKLGKKIVIERSLDENKSWLLDIFLDSRGDIEEQLDNDGNVKGFEAPDLNNVNALRKARANIEKILSEILRQEVRLSTNYRGIGFSRLKIVDKDRKDIVPSLDNLSFGQSVLFNLFASIIRYSDKNDPNKGIKIEDIEGIVIIDEIDAHLHTDLQKDVLPNLIGLFPKIQFIITTHSPLYLLGMERFFGDNKFVIKELPEGISIPVERFSEFENAYQAFAQTTKYEKDIETYVKKNYKPVIFVEGPTDVKYIQKSAELLNRKKCLNDIVLKQIGEVTKQGTKNSNNDVMVAALKFLKVNEPMLNSKILLLFDVGENQKEDSYYNKLFIRQINTISNNPIQKGIENLFET